jgi:hypothetical protein
MLITTSTKVKVVGLGFLGDSFDQTKGKAIQLECWDEKGLVRGFHFIIWK